MGNFKDLSGLTFGEWFVIKRVENKDVRSVSYLCRCSCGREKVVRACHLSNGASKSCGLSLNVIGKKFGYLTVVSMVGRNKNGSAIFKCLCDCGKEKDICSSDFLNGGTTSCGCMRFDKITKHGLSSHPLHMVWSGIKERCYNENCYSYKMYYGAKGITVCDEWRDNFQSFYDWSTNNGYQKGLTIDRIDGDASYSPENCRWVSYRVQANNTSRNHLITYIGKTDTLANFSREFNIPQRVLWSRINKGWTVEDALTIGVRKQKRGLV